MPGSSESGAVKPCKPPRLRKECVTDQSGGDKGEACDWERTLPAGPSARTGTRGDEQQRVVPRSSLTNMRTCTGKGSAVVVDALNGDSTVRWVSGQQWHEVQKNRQVAGRRTTCREEYFAAQKVVKLLDTLVAVDAISSIGRASAS